MANRIVEKHSTWTKDTYINPINMPAHYHYSPYLHTTFGGATRHGEGTDEWFHDYRRSYVAERTLRNGQLAMNPPPIRPTNYSDSPDRVLGWRTMRREALRTKPDVHLLNRIPDREREKDRIDNLTFQHRQQYRDRSGTLYERKVPRFHYPTEADEQFLPKIRLPADALGNYPNNRRAALEGIYDFPRGPKHFELWWKV